MKLRKHIHDNDSGNTGNELQTVAPRLSELKKSNPFDAPQGYFDALPDALLSKVKRHDELVKMLSDDRRGEKQNPFTLPSENYFEQFPELMMQRASAEPKVIPLQRFNWKSAMSIAAAVVALMMLSLPMLKQSRIAQHASTQTATANAVNASLKNVSDSELDTYLNTDVSALQEEDVAAGLSETQLDKAATRITVEHIGNDASQELTPLDIETL